MKHSRENYASNLILLILKPVLFFLCILSLFIWGIYITNRTSNEESLHLAEENIRKAVISCYALEGRYPQSFEYLEKNYGINIDTDKYTVFYSVFASNIMPDITVIEK
jgi:hypothetical protein